MGAIERDNDVFFSLYLRISKPAPWYFVRTVFVCEGGRANAILPEYSTDTESSWGSIEEERSIATRELKKKINKPRRIKVHGVHVAAIRMYNETMMSFFFSRRKTK